MICAAIVAHSINFFVKYQLLTTLHIEQSMDCTNPHFVHNIYKAMAIVTECSTVVYRIIASCRVYVQSNACVHLVLVNVRLPNLVNHLCATFKDKFRLSKILVKLNFGELTIPFTRSNIFTCTVVDEC